MERVRMPHALSVAIFAALALLVSTATHGAHLEHARTSSDVFPRLLQPAQTVPGTLTLRSDEDVL